MTVKDVCTRTVITCTAETTLAYAGWAMWEGDCGILPVVDGTGKVVGVITDRDICMSAATNYRPAAEMVVRDVLSQNVKTCNMEDDVRDALKTIRQSRIRRLSVVDDTGKIQGLLSMNDVALATRSDLSANPTALTYEDLALAMKSICSRPAAEKKRQSLAVRPAPARDGAKVTNPQLRNDMKTMLFREAAKVNLISPPPRPGPEPPTPPPKDPPATDPTPDLPKPTDPGPETTDPDFPEPQMTVEPDSRLYEDRQF